jgi:transcriptional regulator with XRE-family HTH domain
MGWSFFELERRTGVSKNTLVRFEAGGGVHNATAAKIEEALAKEGLTFLDEDDNRGPGVLLSKELSRRLAQPSEHKAKPSHRKTRTAAK